MMNNKHEINYKLIFSVLVVINIFTLLMTIMVWEKDLLAGILVTIFFIVINILSIKQLFIPQRVKNVTVNSDAIIIGYRNTNVEIPYKDCKKIEHYKHGPFTERIYVYAKDYVYEIPFDLKDFHEMCASIYSELSKIHMENVSDEWFHKELGKGYQPRTESVRETSGERFFANFPLMWILMGLQFILAISLTAFIWNSINVLFKIVWPVCLVFIEYLGVLVITSPKLTRSVTITEDEIIIEFKKKSVEVQFSSCETIKYQKPWPQGMKRIYIIMNNGQYGLLPWYIKNFRGMCRSLYKALENADMESIADKKFRKKFGKGGRSLNADQRERICFQRR